MRKAAASVSTPDPDTLTANVVHRGSHSSRRLRRRRHSVPGVSDPKRVLRRDLSPFVGEPVLLTIEIAGQKMHYRGRLVELLEGQASGKGAGAVMRCEGDQGDQGDRVVTVALR